MNIWIFNHYATIPKFNGGTRHFDIAQELIKHGHSVTIVASSFNHFSKIETINYPNNKSYYSEEISGVNFIWIKTLPYIGNKKRVLNMLSFYFNGKKALRKISIQNKPDIVIGSTVHLLAAQLALDFSRQFNAKFFFEERDFWPQTFIDFGKLTEDNLLSKLLFKYEKYFYLNSDKVIVLFNNADEYLLSKGVTKDKIVILPNGFSENFKSSSIQNIELDEALKDDCIIYIGSHGLANDLDSIIELARICKNIDVKFIFIGDGLYKPELIAKSKSYDLGNVLFFDPVSKNEVYQILSRAKFSVISIKDSPLYKYGFSMNKIFDYFKAEKPIIMIAPIHLAEEFNFEGISVSEDLQKQKRFIIDNLNNQQFYNKNVKSIKQKKENYSWKTLTRLFLKEV